jgi:hypothetical protein
MTTTGQEDTADPARQSISCTETLRLAEAVGDMMFKFFNGENYVVVINADGIVTKTWDVPSMPFGLEAGKPIKPGSTTHHVLSSKARVEQVVSRNESVFGFPYSVISYPLVATDGTFSGVLSMASSLRKEDIKKVASAILTIVDDTNVMGTSVSQASDQLRDTMSELTQIGNDVRDGVSVIVDVIRFIRSVADQTNLLGLNVSTEAARAGNSGAGFMVVAREIRKLSESAKTSIIQLNVILASMSATISRMDPQIVHLHGNVEEQARSIAAIHDLTFRLQALSQQLEQIT